MPFDGETYERPNDRGRLTSQLSRVRRFMCDGEWHKLDEILEATAPGTVASVSARLRDLRKKKFGGQVVDRRRVGDSKDGVFEYRLDPDTLSEPVKPEPKKKLRSHRIFG